MFCIKCGAKNSEEAVFCQKCGTRFETESEEELTLVASQGEGEDTPEKELFSIRPTLLFVQIGYGLAVLGAFLVVALFSIFSQMTGISIPAWISVIAGISLLLIPAYFHLRQKMVLYTLTDSKVSIDEGLIARTTRNVPLRIIQDVTVSANFFQRILGFGDLEIENANENDGRILLKNINSPAEAADMLLKQMRRLDKS